MREISHGVSGHDGPQSAHFFCTRVFTVSSVAQDNVGAVGRGRRGDAKQRHGRYKVNGSTAHARGIGKARARTRTVRQAARRSRRRGTFRPTWRRNAGRSTFVRPADTMRRGQRGTEPHAPRKVRWRCFYPARWARSCLASHATRSLRRASRSIWRARSRDRDSRWPISSRVRCVSPPTP